MRILIASVLAAAASAADLEVIQATYGGHPFTVRLDTAQARIPLRSAADLGNGLTGHICVSASRAVVDRLCGIHGLLVVESVGSGWVLKPLDPTDRGAALRALPAIGMEAGVRWSEPVLLIEREQRFTPVDPLYVDPDKQWQLSDDWSDLQDVWDVARGDEVRISIVDSGVKTNHEDLAGNLVAGWDLLANDADPSPGTGTHDNHGTMVAGVAGAIANSKGGVGVACESTLVPLRFIGSGMTNAKAATALGWGLPGYQPAGSGAVEVDVSNNSYGPPDKGFDNGATDSPSSLESDALEAGVTSGRSGKGVIYSWSCGNGGEVDTCDRDGYASDYRVIAIGALARDGLRASYSEAGGSLFASIPVGEFTDPGAYGPSYAGPAGARTDTYEDGFGTSFAAPMLSGVVALMLDANPDLTWRDVRHILASTCRVTDATDGNWLTNGAGLHWNIQYGFGMVDPYEAVSAAQAWTPIPASAVPLTATFPIPTPIAIPDDSSIGASPVAVPVSADARFRAEWVELTVTPNHPYQGDLAYILKSPRGTEVVFLGRPNDNAAARTWTYTSVATWGEDPSGTWTLTPCDVGAGDTGTLVSASLRIRGYLATSSAAPGTGTAVGTTLAIRVGGTKSSSPGGGGTGGGGTGGAPDSDGGGGGGCGLGSGLALLAAAFAGLRLATRRRP